MDTSADRTRVGLAGANKVPGLGEFPIVGRLFGEQTDRTTKTEIVLSITPRILRNVQRPDADVLEFESGTDSNLRTWSSIAGGGTVVAATTTPNATVGSPAATGSPAADANAAGLPAGTAPAVTTVPAVAPTAARVPVHLRWVAPAQVKAGDTFTAELTASPRCRSSAHRWCWSSIPRCFRSCPCRRDLS